MNAKAKGTRLELKSIRRLEAGGYYCARSAKSGGVWDIWAMRQINPFDIKLIQVKANRWPGTEEMERMEQFRTPSNAIKEVWRWDDYVKEPRVRPIARCDHMNHIPIMEPERID